MEDIWEEPLDQQEDTDNDVEVPPQASPDAESETIVTRKRVSFPEGIKAPERTVENQHLRKSKRIRRTPARYTESEQAASELRPVVFSKFENTTEPIVLGMNAKNRM